MTTSSDGFLTATVDSTTASIVLSVNFAATTAYFVTVTRSDGTVVRGLDTASAPKGQVTGIDHEAPLGSAVVYTATCFTAAGVVVSTSTTATATITALAAGAWIKSLTYPALSVLVTIKQSPDWQYGITQGVFTVAGRADAVIVSDVVQYPSGTLVVTTLTNTDQNNLQTLLMSAGPYLLQTISADNDPDRYIVVGQAGTSSSSTGSFTVQRPIRIIQEPWRDYQLPVTMVARPATSGATVTIPAHSYNNTTASLATYSARTGTYASRA